MEYLFPIFVLTPLVLSIITLIFEAIAHRWRGHSHPTKAELHASQHKEWQADFDALLPQELNISDQRRLHVARLVRIISPGQMKTLELEAGKGKPLQRGPITQSFSRGGYSSYQPEYHTCPKARPLYDKPGRVSRPLYDSDDL